MDAHTYSTWTTLQSLKNQPLPSGATRTTLGLCCWMSMLFALLMSGAHAQDLITNGTFDTDINGWNAANGVLAFDGTEGSNSGPGSMNIDTQTSDSLARQCVTGVLGNTPYVFGADFRVDSGGFLNVCRIQLDQYDSGNCAGVSGLPPASAEQTVVQPSPTYTSLGSSFVTTASTNAILVNLFCSENGTAHSVNWDDVYLISKGVESVTYTLLVGQGDALNHMPGDNGLIGDGDDRTQADPTPVIGSDPNYRGAYSYRSERVFNTPAEPGLADQHNRVAYLEGTIDVIPGGGGIVSSDLRLTGRRQGMGLRSPQPWDGGTPEGDSYLSGTILTIDAPFNATGIPYVDTILIPKAQELAAESLLYADLSGLNPPGTFHPNGLPTRLVIVGVRGLTSRSIDNLRAAGAATRGLQSTDLMVTKTSDVTGLQAPGTTVTYTLNVENTGAELATDVQLHDRIPTAAVYLDNDCAAPAPVNDLFIWSIGDLPSMDAVSCQVTVDIQLDANIDVDNAAIVYGDQWDSDLDNNVSEARVEVLDDMGPGVSQEPDQLMGFQSDLSCNGCGSGNQAMADAFKVDSFVELCGLSFHGGYTNNIPYNDQFQITIRENRRVTPGLPGVPGDPVATITGLMSRFATGMQIGTGLDEYLYSVNPAGSPITLARGTYWLVIVNDSSGTRGGTGDWFWESGVSDASGLSIPGLAFNPGFVLGSPGWGTNPQLETAFTLCANEVLPPAPEIFSDGFE